MTTLIQMLSARGINLSLRDGRLVVSGSRAAMTAELARQIWISRAGLEMHLSGRLRSSRFLAYHVHAGDVVQTPQGEGEVLQVFEDRVTVRLAGRALFFAPEQISIRRGAMEPFGAIVDAPVSSPNEHEIDGHHTSPSLP